MQQTWTRERINAAAEALAMITPPEPTLNKAQALSALMPRLKEMQRAGHSTDAIAQHLSDLGLCVSARTLERNMRASAPRLAAGRAAARRTVKLPAAALPPSERSPTALTDSVEDFPALAQELQSRS